MAALRFLLAGVVIGAAGLLVVFGFLLWGQPANRLSTPVATSPPAATVAVLPTSAEAPGTTSRGSPGPSPTTAATPGTPASSHNVLVGPGYSDVSPRQVVRTSDNRVWIVVPTCEYYPTCDANHGTARQASNSLVVYRADQTGTPTSFTRMDEADEPRAVGGAAVAVDGLDRLHIVWMGLDGTGTLNERIFDTATGEWGPTSVLDSATYWTAAAFGQGKEAVALSLDSRGAAHVVYLKASGPDATTELYYTNNVAGTWSPGIRVDDQPFGPNQRVWNPALAHTASDQLLIGWLVGAFNGDEDGTIYVRVRNPDGSFDSTANVSGTSAARTGIDQGPSLLVTPDGTWHITFIAQPNDAIRYSYNAGSEWIADDPGGDDLVTHNPSLGPDGAGGVRIYGHGTPDPIPDGSGSDLYYVEKSKGGNWSAWTLYATGPFDSSVSTRWSASFMVAPGTLDIIYWDANYPNTLYFATDVVAPVGGAPSLPGTLPPTAARPNPGTTSPDWIYFPETGHYLAYGFRSFWELNGGLPVFGIPLTEEFTDEGYTVQYFERQRFEYHPEHAGTPYGVELGRLGAGEAQSRGLLGTAPFRPLPTSTTGDANCDFFAQTGHRVCFGFRDYWRSHGLEFGDPSISYRESLALFGYPIGEEFTDPVTGLTVQYFERARFEYHPENPESYRVLLGRLGAEAVSAFDQ